MPKSYTRIDVHRRSGECGERKRRCAHGDDRVRSRRHRPGAQRRPGDPADPRVPHRGRDRVADPRSARSLRPGAARRAPPRRARDPSVLDRSLAVRLVDATGRPVWMEATVQRVGDYPGADRVLAVHPYGPRSAEEALVGTDRDSNRFHALVQSSADIVMVLDPDGTVALREPGDVGTLGLAPDDLVVRRSCRSSTPTTRSRSPSSWSPSWRSRAVAQRRVPEPSTPTVRTAGSKVGCRTFGECRGRRDPRQRARRHRSPPRRGGAPSQRGAVPVVGGLLAERDLRARRRRRGQLRERSLVQHHRSRPCVRR